jgi:hypothetical protein
MVALTFLVTSLITVLTVDTVQKRRRFVTEGK